MHLSFLVNRPFVRSHHLIYFNEPISFSMSSVVHPPGFIYFYDGVMDLKASSPFETYGHALDFKPVAGDLFDDRFSRHVLRAFQTICGHQIDLGDHTGFGNQLGLVVINQSTGRLIFQNVADVEFLIATNSYL